MTDPEFLNWIADRFVYVIGESENVDFVQRLRQIAVALTPEPKPEPKPLWGRDGPRVGQVITIAGTSMQTRWNGHSWEMVE